MAARKKAAAAAPAGPAETASVDGAAAPAAGPAETADVEMVEVRQVSIDASPAGVFLPGHIRHLPADHPHIDAGYVERTDG